MMTWALSLLTSRLAGPIAAGLSIVLAITLAITMHQRDVARRERADLLGTISTATGATDGKGNPAVLGVASAQLAVRGLAEALHTADRIARENAAADARTVIASDRKNEQIATEVSTHVLDQLSETRRRLDAATALAAERLRQLRAAAGDPGGAGGTAPAYDPEPACRTYADTGCQGLLAKLAAAEEWRDIAVGWQQFYPQVKANLDGAIAEIEARPK